MHVFGNLRVLIRCLRLMGLLSIKRHCGADGKPLFGTTSYAALKFTGFFIATVLGCGYLISQGSQEYDVLSQKGAIWPIVYVVHNVTFSVVFFVLPWQTFRQRYRLAAAMTALYQNEADLVKLTGNGTNYRIVSLLATVVMWNGVILHVFFHSYYISQNYSTGNDFLPIYFRSWLFMYVDLAMELILGVCDCSLLIARLQLERLVGIAKDFASSAETDRLLQFHVELYGKIVNLLRLDLSPYFGPIVLSFCVYVCLEVAVCSLDAHSLIGSKDRPIMAVLANIMWPLSDIKKLSALLLLGEGVNVMVEETALCTRHFDDYRLQNTRAAKQIQKFLLKNLHQKKKFSACGFFDIDNTVIYMVFSSIVTYLVILIQFKQLETDLTQSEGVFNVTSNLTTPGPS
uniref:Gustatory receptor n=1 Tax=Anopheles dirus TaxID=7168 RepID=A0A182NBW8_9DIPT